MKSNIDDNNKCKLRQRLISTSSLLLILSALLVLMPGLSSSQEQEQQQQQQEQQEHQQTEYEENDKARELVILESMYDVTKNSIVRFDSPIFGIDKSAEKIMNNIFDMMEQNLPKQFVTLNHVKCGEYPGVCVRGIGMIPTADGKFGRRFKGSLDFEMYVGPRNVDMLLNFLSFQTPPNQQQQQQHQQHQQQDCPSSLQECQPPKRDDDIIMPPRPKGRGVYIYEDPWAMILDEQCDVTTFPLVKQEGHGDDDDDVPVLDANAPKTSLRDPGYFAVMRPFLRHTIDASDHYEDGSNKGIRIVDDPEQARWFLVPFDFDRSYTLGDCVNNKDGTISTHLSRIDIIMDGLKKSKYHERRNGTDHVFVILHFQLGMWRRRLLQNSNEYFPNKYMPIIRPGVLLRYMDLPMRLNLGEKEETITTDMTTTNNPMPAWIRQSMKEQYLDEVTSSSSSELFNHYGFEPKDGSNGNSWWAEGVDHRCTSVVPTLTPKSIEQQAQATDKNETFEAWLDRPYLFHYRGNGKKIPVAGSKVLHEMTQAMRDIFPKDSVVIENDHTTRDGYANELSKSKFCLVVRGDDPQRSRFNDAVAAGCIPVQINDGFDLAVAPQSMEEIVNYNSFMVTIPERMFLTNAPSALYLAYGLPKSKLKKMHRNLLYSRPYICWGLSDGPTKSVGYLAWEQINEYCDLDDQ